MSRIPHMTIVSVASEAGTHWSGQSKAPSALLNHGLSSKLSSDYAIALLDALPLPELYSSQPLVNGVRNENAVLKVMHRVKATISSLDNSTILLILGGDCSITPAILSALCNTRNKRIGVLYLMATSIYLFRPLPMNLQILTPVFWTQWWFQT